jgi:MFS transporter, SP family, galactose:H+ symporter
MSFYLAATVAALSGLLFGYDTGIISSALFSIRQVLPLSPTMQGIVVAIALAGAVLGAVMAGFLSDRAGRRRVILSSGLLFVSGAGISAIAQGVTVLLIGRFLVGLAIGATSMVAPLYLAEISPPNHRGAIVSLNQLCAAGGALASYAVGFWLISVSGGWRWMLAFAAVPGAILFLGMLVLPESPRWLAGHDRLREARIALQRLRGSDLLDVELSGLWTDLLSKGLHPARASELFAPRLRRPLAIGIGLAMFQQITGINAVICFAPTIFQSAGLSSTATSLLTTIGVGAVNVGATVVAVHLVDRLGRRKLLLWSLSGMAAALVLLSGTFYVGAPGRFAWIPVAAVAAYVGFFAIGLGPVFWLLVAEIFPLRLRGRAMSLATVANWCFNIIVSATFLDLVGALGPGGVFLDYAILSVVAAAFTALIVPETKGRTLEQIEDALNINEWPPRADYGSLR